MRLSVRTRSLVLLVALIAVSCTSGRPSTWTWTTSPAPSPSTPPLPSPVASPSRSHPRLLGVQFLTDTDGVLILCYESARGCPEQLAATHDGGRRWRTVGPIPNFVGLTFVSSEVGYGLLHRRFVRTTNGGRSFTVVSKLPFDPGTEPEGENTSLSFIDADHGWVASTPSLFSTSDGGRSWTRLPFSCPDRFVGIGSTSFVDAVTGFLTCEGEGATAMAEKALYRTDDAGQSWTLVSAAELDHDVGRLPWIGTGAQILFIDETVGFIMAGRYGMARTDDGGRTFRTILATDDVDDVAGTTWLDRETGFAALFQGRLVRTDDAGRHWRTIYRPRPRRTS